jgi:hypothetical protein
MLPSTGTNVGLVRGALYDSDIDCYSLSVPDGASLYAEMTYPSGLCPSPRSFDTAFGIAILDGSDVAIGSDVSSGVRGCPRIDGNDPAFPWARNLRGGTYKVCVRNRAVFASPVSSYLLSVMLSAP